MRKLALTILSLFIVSLAVAQMPGMTPFSADMAMNMKDGHNMAGKVYVTFPKMRTEFNAAGRTMVSIMDMANKVMYQVMPEQKMYMEMHLDEMGKSRGIKMPDVKSYDPSNPCAQVTDMTCQKVGTENVNGRNTDKWIFTNKKDNTTMTTWIDPKLHYAIRTVTAGMQMDLTNIKEGPVASSMFEVPAGYQKFDMGKMMGGRSPQ